MRKVHSQDALRHYSLIGRIDLIRRRAGGRAFANEASTSALKQNER